MNIDTNSEPMKTSMHVVYVEKERVRGKVMRVYHLPRLVPILYLRNSSVLHANGKKCFVAESCFFAVHLQGFGKILANQGSRWGRHVSLSARAGS